jgi:histidinol-phosphate aminotransferase
VDEMNERVAHLVEERGRLVARLAELPLEIWPSGANFVLFRPQPEARVPDGHALWQSLLERSILVRDFSSMARLDGCLRVTIGTPEENDTFLDALTETLT